MPMCSSANSYARLTMSTAPSVFCCPSQRTCAGRPAVPRAAPNGAVSDGCERRRAPPREAAYLADVVQVDPPHVHVEARPQALLKDAFQAVVPLEPQLQVGVHGPQPALRCEPHGTGLSP